LLDPLNFTMRHGLVDGGARAGPMLRAGLTRLREE